MRFILLLPLVALIGYSAPSVAGELLFDDLTLHEVAPPVDIPPEVTRLMRVIEQRNDTARLVAIYKSKARLPLEDLKREQEVIASAVEAGKRHGLSEDRVRTFFADQIKASKFVQSAVMTNGLFEKLPDLAPGEDLASLRIVLDQIQEELLSSLAAFDNANYRERCRILVGTALESKKREKGYPLMMMAATAQATISLCKSD
ncbi:gamma subclass chorismate mutase AroQ [Pseudomonas sp. GD04058]|uniref:gamma subclass chorismate mutase AroQ n=1 Tax=Pseudomonas sp. GD04058 TaxID=2975429 RepID=UPI00244C305F|nr:gamma subclass chorismate mutase AroQ [Pseudomonas sp. GD04058]MDG9881521.1 gamma subclass chorismate mutase AroQ [Pseudomonas sp. GD04058]